MFSKSSPFCPCHGPFPDLSGRACSFILPSAPKSLAWLPLDSFTGPSFTGTAGKTAMKSPQLISRKWRNGVDAKFVS